jgi:putative heme-binding domain-containing protein
VGLDAMMTLISQYDGKDRWYLEAMAIAARGREDAIYARLKTGTSGLAPSAMGQVVWAIRPKAALPDLVAALNDASRAVPDREMAIDTLTNMEWPEATQAIEAFVQSDAAPPALAARAFAGYAHQLYSLWTDARSSTDLPRLVRRALTMPASQAAAVDLIGRLLDPQYLPDLVTLAKAETASPDARATAIALVATTNDPQYGDVLKGLSQSAPTPVRAAAVRAVANLAPADAVTWAQGLLLSDAPNAVRVEAVRLMAASPAGLTGLLDLAEKGQLPAEFRTLASSVTNNARGAARGRGGFASVMAARGGGAGAAPADALFTGIRERAARVLPAPAAAATAIPGIQALERNYRGSATAGRLVFEQDAGCAACHSLGGARTLGPDLSAIGQKYGKQALLDNILRPSDAIGLEYVVTTFTLKSGEAVTGIVSDATPEAVVVRTSAIDERRLRPADIASRQTSGVSLMPEGLLNALSLQQVSDLLEFLSTLQGM